MKRGGLVLLCAMLSACAGGNDGGKVGAVTPIVKPGDNVFELNKSVTNMQAVIDNKAEIISNVEEKLGKDFYQQNGDGTAEFPLSRNSVSKDMNTFNDNRYELAKAKIEDMNFLLSSSAEALKEIAENNPDFNERLTDAYLLAGGNKSDLDDYVDSDSLIDFVLSNTEVINNSKTVYNENQYKQFNLDNALFTVPGTSGDDLNASSGAVTKLKFQVDEKGKITAVDILDFESVGGDLSGEPTRVQTMQRQGNTNILYADDFHNGKLTASIKTFGKDFGMRYSDFGQIESEIKNYETGAVDYTKTGFAGGYEAKKIKPEKMLAENMKFEGLAIGSVFKNDTGDDIDLSGKATLNFDQGKETLNMKFSEGDNPWYDVTIVRNGADNSITFSNDAVVREQDKISGIGPDGSKTQNNYLTGDYQGKPGENRLEINYYGDGNRATEFTGTTLYNDDEIEMNVGFGGVLVK